MLVITFRRIYDDWSTTEGEGSLTLDGCSTGFESVEYLAWQGKGRSLAIEVPDIIDMMHEGSGDKQLLVLWVTGAKAVLDWGDSDKHFQDLFYVASRSRHLLRFVPDDACAVAKMSVFPPLLADQEERVIGPKGGPMYVLKDYRTLRTVENRFFEGVLKFQGPFLLEPAGSRLLPVWYWKVGGTLLTNARDW